MELSKNQIARIQCKDLESLVKASNNSRDVLDAFTAGDNRYTYNVEVNHDELYYDLYLYRTKYSN
jgi:hypothetical protein